MWPWSKKSAAEDEEETSQNAVPRVSLTGADTCIDIPKPEGTLALLEKPYIDKKVKRHSIHGMMEEENVIRPHQEIAQLSLEEKKFLLAVERGDVASTRRMLQRAEETAYININCVDPLGRSALLMAIDNENLEMVELLIEHKVETKDALLHAISEEFVEAVEVLLDHEETIHKLGEPHSWEALPPDTATFTPDITPLILSAHRDNYEIIKILLDRGATLPMPHDVRCGCDECVTSRMEDSLRHSRSRINAYRALASPSLIALSSKDPILTAFELSWELRRLSFMEHEFKLEYLELRKQCQDFATALLDHTRSSYELEVLLNHDPTGPAFEHGERMHLNRLKLAIKLRQKKDTGLYIVDNSPNMTAGHLCAVVAQSYNCEGDVPEWSIDIPERTEISTIEAKKSTFDEEPIRILHIADIHYDPLYLAGSNAICDTYVCCQADLGMAEDPANGAGYWGDYRGCDTPLYVIQNALENMKENGDYDVIYFTGDIISHRMWDTSKERNLQEAHEIHDELRKAFPNTPIFSIFGNHEAHPVNCYAPTYVPEELSSQWLYDDVAEVWGQNFPEEAKATIRQGGFYNVLVRPGFRVIGINGNTGYRYNWWILYEADPLGQLQWLSDQLYQAEQNGEKVHILSHNPSSEGSAFRIWSREYRRVIDRFAHVITGAFNGHTHQDEIILYHSLENPTEPINIAWNGGSVTTISHLNNNYRIFTMDPSSFELLDFDVWSFNVTHANLTPDIEPEWFKLYSFKETYGVEDLSPQSIRNLAIRMTEDHELAKTYWRYRHRLADTALASGCGESCLKGLVCRMLKSEVDDSTQCDEITGDW